MSEIHGGNASYGVAGEKVLLRNKGEDIIAHFNGFDFTEDGVTLIFNIDLYKKVIIPASAIKGVDWTEEEDYEEEIPLVTYS